MTSTYIAVAKTYVFRKWFWIPAILVIPVSFIFRLGGAVQGLFFVPMMAAFIGLHLKEQFTQSSITTIPSFRITHLRVGFFVSAVFTFFLPLALHVSFGQGSFWFRFLSLYLFSFSIVLWCAYLFPPFAPGVAFLSAILITMVHITEFGEYLLHETFPIFATALLIISIMSLKVFWNRLRSVSEETWDHKWRSIFVDPSMQATNWARSNRKKSWGRILDFILMRRDVRFDIKYIGDGLWSLATHLRGAAHASMHGFVFVIPGAILTFLFLSIWYLFKSDIIGQLSKSSLLSTDPVFFIFPLILGVQFFYFRNFGYEVLRSVSRVQYVRALFLGYILMMLEIIFAFLLGACLWDLLFFGQVRLLQNMQWLYLVPLSLGTIGPVSLGALYSRKQMESFGLTMVLFLSCACAYAGIALIGYFVFGQPSLSWTLLLVVTLMTWISYRCWMRADLH